MRRLHDFILTAVIALLLAIAASSAARAGEAPAIAAAADLKFALTEVADAFRAETGREVRLTFGSSGNFFRQLQESAPFEIYFSADEQFVFDLAAMGLTADQGELYATGRIVLFAPHGSPLQVDAALAGLRTALAEGRITRFAIANPDHAPYGRRAEEALRHAGLWEALADRLVLGENVAQAAQFATSGNAQGGIIAYSLALAPEVQKRGSFALIPQDWHAPLRQRMVLLKNAGPVAEQFFAYMQSPPARAIMVRYGFILPHESS